MKLIVFFIKYTTVFLTFLIDRFMLFVSRVSTFLLIIYYKCTKRFDYDFWKKRNVKGPEPSRFFGNYKDIVLGKNHICEFAQSFYDEYKSEKMIGLFALNRPVLILCDPELIQDVLKSDFSAFSDRGIHVFDTVEPHSQHLFNMPYRDWKDLRLHLTAPFTSLRNEMFEAVQDVADEFIAFMEKKVAKEDRVNCSDLFDKFTISVIGKYCLKLDMNHFKEEENKFQLEVNAKRKSPNYFTPLKKYLREYDPDTYEFLVNVGVWRRNYRTIDYFVTMLKDIEEYRKLNNVREKDFAGTLLELKSNPDKVSVEVTDNLLGAQIYVLFTAATDSGSVLISYGLYELAMNETIQEKLRNEIHETLKNTDKKFSSKDLKKMKYLDNVYKEILRKYILRNLVRTSNRPYKFKGTDVEVPANTKIIIPNYAIHRDAEYYPNPEIFHPERFENQENPKIYLPFGQGPRYCLGQELGENIMKVLIVKVIQNFNIKINPTDAKMKEYDPLKVFLWPKGGIHLRFERRTS